MSARIFKISLHESGDWRLQWIKSDHEDVRWQANGPNPTESTRILDQWQRPPSDSVGWTDALSIWVPDEDIADIPGDGETGRDVQWTPPPGVGRSVEFRFLLVQPRLGRFDLTPAFRDGEATVDLVNGFRLANGEVLLLFAVNGPIDAVLQQQLKDLRNSVRLETEPTFDISPESGPRAAVHTIGPDGHRGIWDLSHQPC